MARLGAAPETHPAEMSGSAPCGHRPLAGAAGMASRPQPAIARAGGFIAAGYGGRRVFLDFVILSSHSYCHVYSCAGAVGRHTPWFWAMWMWADFSGLAVSSMFRSSRVPASRADRHFFRACVSSVR